MTSKHVKAWAGAELLQSHQLLVFLEQFCPSPLADWADSSVGHHPVALPERLSSSQPKKRQKGSGTEPKLANRRWTYQIGRRCHVLQPKHWLSKIYSQWEKKGRPANGCHIIQRDFRILARDETFGHEVPIIWTTAPTTPCSIGIFHCSSLHGINSMQP